MLKVAARSIPLFSFNIVFLLFFSHSLSGVKGDRSPVYAEIRYADSLALRQDTTFYPVVDTLPDTISFSIVGDLMVGSSYPAKAFLPKEEEGNILQYAMPLLQATDLRIGNLESAVSDSAKVFKNCGNSTQCFAFRTPYKQAMWYKEAGFEYLNLANNHSYDFGQKGVTHTLAFLDSVNIKTSGVPDRVFDTLTVRNTKIGFVSFAPHTGCLDMNDDSLVRATIAEVRPLCQLLVVFFHGGGEGSGRTHTPKGREFFLGQNRGDVRHFAHMCINEGADLVIGSGPHVVRAMERYKGKLVAYSLGNFATYHQFNLKYPNNIAPLLRVKITSEGNLVEHKVFSFLQEGEGIPKPDTTSKAFKMIRNLSVEDFGSSAVEEGVFD
ncbi:Poly-gamma-glutamate biosynthesis protein CapA/YwtB (capsule formation), metallophosphatase superfamily [Chitinophaga sp. YR627]|uniref:CapA family protein n=1 Tax=Chitinophaga sp. YR627 TaxID=1881041 RepID=UPI0008F3CE57|nr:CapA family protein [Chitinophaga sp. YR627]SFN02312.1 Poly-gamma-glutamate biosynthesis protein CapA/YwtB (capsule formation), metallophosphatase superfamily [Chitinophaga sp. YR627]